MAKGQHLSAYQQKIVNRYYEHLDTIAIDKLSQSVSDLYLCTDTKKADKLWAGVEKALDKIAVNNMAVKVVLAKRDIKALAQLVNDLSDPSRNTKKTTGPRPGR